MNNFNNPHKTSDIAALVGVGGSGASVLRTIAKKLASEDGTKFGEVGRNGRVIVAMLIDSDESVTEPDGSSPENQRLIDAGVRTLTLSPELDQSLRTIGLKDQLSDDFPTERDRNGSRGDHRVGACKALIARREIITGLEDMITDVMNIRADHNVGDAVDVGLIAGMSGGTGPMALQILPDLVQIVRRYLLGAHRSTGLYLTSGEAAMYDPTVRNLATRGQQHINSAVTAARLNLLLRQGGAVLPDGEFVEGAPDHVVIAGGRNEHALTKRLYDPTDVLGAYLDHKIFGDSARSHRSNAGLVLGKRRSENAPVPGTVRIGASRMLVDSSGSIGQVRKQRIEDIKSNVLRLDHMDQTRADAIVDGARMSNLSTLGLELIREVDGLSVPELDKVALTPETALSEADATLDSFRSKHDQAVSKARTEAQRKYYVKAEEVMNSIDTVRNKHGIDTAIAVCNGLASKFEVAINDMDIPSAAELQRERDALRADSVRRGLPKIAIWKRKDEVASLQFDIDRLGDKAREYAEKSINAACAVKYRQIMTAVISRLRLKAQELLDLKANIESTINVLEADINSTTIGTQSGEHATPFDLEVEGTFAPQDADYSNLRVQLERSNWDIDVIRGMLTANEINPDEANIQGAITPEAVRLMTRRAKALIAPSDYYRHNAAKDSRTNTHSNGRGSVKPINQLLVPESLINAFRNALPTGFDAELIGAGDDIVPTMISEEHGYSVLDDEHFMSGIEFLINATPEERRKAFITKEDQDRLLPGLSLALAQFKLESNGGKGSITQDEEGVSHYIEDEASN